MSKRPKTPRHKKHPMLRAEDLPNPVVVAKLTELASAAGKQMRAVPGFASISDILPASSLLVMAQEIDRRGGEIDLQEVTVDTAYPVRSVDAQAAALGLFARVMASVASDVLAKSSASFRLYRGDEPEQMIVADKKTHTQERPMRKSTRRSLVKLAHDKVVASTSEEYADLARFGYAERLGLIATPGAKRSSSLRAGYRITELGVERAAKLNDDGTAKLPEEALPAPGSSPGGMKLKHRRRKRGKPTAKRS